MSLGFGLLWHVFQLFWWHFWSRGSLARRLLSSFESPNLAQLRRRCVSGARDFRRLPSNGVDTSTRRIKSITVGGLLRGQTCTRQGALWSLEKWRLRRSCNCGWLRWRWSFRTRRRGRCTANQLLSTMWAVATRRSGFWSQPSHR